MGAHPTLLFTGASGLLGASIHRLALARHRCVLVQHRRAAPAPLRRGDRVVRADLEASGECERLVEAFEPAAVLHAAARASLADCEADPEGALRANGAVSGRLARAAAACGAHFVLLSTDQVFGGGRGGYGEEDPPDPVTAYGRSKAAAERAALESGGDALVMRAGLVLAPSADGRSGALDLVRGAAAPAGEPPREVRLFADEWRTPLSVADLARLLDEALRRRTTGILHAGGPDRVDRLALGRAIAAAFPATGDLVPPRLVAASRAESGLPRPRDVSLRCARLAREGFPMPRPLKEALDELRALTAAARDE